MDFEKQYLTYEEYRNLGGSKDKASFDLLEFNARNLINKRTFNRLVNKDLKEIKFCVYYLVELMSVNGEYLDGNEETKRIMENNVIENYLSYLVVDGVPVLYIGV